MHETRPRFCVIDTCRPVLCHGAIDELAKGESAFCLGELTTPEAWLVKETEHVNDLSFCVYTPFKGWTRFVVNDGDLDIVATLIWRFTQKTGRKVRIFEKLSRQGNGGAGLDRAHPVEHPTGC